VRLLWLELLFWNTYAFMGDYGFGDPISAPLAASKMRGDQDCLDTGESEGDVHLRAGETSPGGGGAEPMTNSYRSF
jgi:hypothetical protein